MYYPFKIVLIAVFAFYAEYTLISTITAKAKIIETDHFEQLYICENNILKKYDKTGVLLSSYSNQLNGEISAIDVSDPYILLLFYKDLNRIIFLDDRLAAIGKPLKLDNVDLFNSTVVCKSKSFAVWIYDRFDNRLVHYGFNPKGIIQEINLDPLSLEQEVVFMRESGNYLYVNTGKRILIFDQYGAYIKSIIIKLKNVFQINNNHIIYFEGNKLLKHSVNETAVDTLKLDFIEDVEHALIENDRLYIQKTDSVFIYRKAV